MTGENRNPQAPAASDEWMTPPWLAALAQHVLGAVDFDPCSTSRANENIRAADYFTREDDALARAWPHGQRIFMNPPYSRGMVDQFCDKLIALWAQDKLRAAIVVTNNVTDTRWAQRMYDACTALCYLEGRVHFLGVDGTPVKQTRQGQCIWYFGDNKTLFRETFERYGVVLERISTRRGY